ncbi:MAG: hypothetical protein HYZ58_11710 [Acidobacteria bacterium]|nr:hypothetical protein [Acidobacteriota bacterium]
MPTLAILGAGDLGAALASTLARRQWPGEIILVDDASSIAAGKALDILESAPVDGSDTRLTGTADDDRVANADIVAIADRTTGGEWNGEGGLARLRRVVSLAPGGLIVCAGASQAGLMETAARELKLDRRRLVGSAPAALEAAARAVTAAEINAAATEVALFVVGMPPRRMSIAWSGATLHGQPIAAFLDAHRIARIDARLPALWPPGPYALASAASRVCEGLARGSRRLHTSFLVLDGELGPRGRVVALPVRIGVRGVSEVLVPPLSVHERVRLENALGP